INQAIDKLSPVCKEVFLMNRFEGMKPTEIAEQKKISIRTVEKHIGKALKILRKELHQHIPTVLLAIILGNI
ncbi:MAG: sigma factor-like helix-turn-helix DNA-binding protein, partial [Prolixibacteraceae bacterium]|nr:sigma factor-like helix-turn-helix DNA-binding protein [Prolixibacteraceae bacterium]